MSMKLFNKRLKKKSYLRLNVRIRTSWQKWQKTGPFNCSLKTYGICAYPSIKRARGPWIWPAFRTGAKLVVDETGKMLTAGYQFTQNQLESSRPKGLHPHDQEFDVEIITIGNVL